MPIHLILGLCIGSTVCFLGLLMVSSYAGQRYHGYMAGVTIGWIATFYVCTVILALAFDERYGKATSVSVTLLMVCFGVGVATPYALRLAAYLKESDQEDRLVVRSADYTTGSSGNRVVLAVTFALFWASCSAMNLVGIYVAAAWLENLMLGGNSLLTPAVTMDIFGDQFILRSSAGPFFVPLLGIWGIHSTRLLRELRQVKQHTRVRITANLRESIRRVTSFAHLATPLLIIDQSSKVDAVAQYVIGGGPTITISQGALAKLSEIELEALLAHEVCHLKRHAFMLAVLDLISMLSLFGKGTLAILFDTRRFETEADMFSCSYLADVGSDSEVLVDVLHTIRSKSGGYSGHSRSALALAPVGTDQKAGQDLNFADRVAFLWELYFGDCLMSYLHPTIDERIRRIRGLSK